MKLCLSSGQNLSLTGVTEQKINKSEQPTKIKETNKFWSQNNILPKLFFIRKVFPSLSSLFLHKTF